MSIWTEASNEEVYLKKGGKLKNHKSPCLMTVEQIQDLIANAVKAQFEEERAKLTFTPSLIPKE